MDETRFELETADGVMGVDRDQRIVLWNGGAYAMLGFKRQDVIGRYCYDVFGGRDGAGCIVCQADCGSIMAMRRQELEESRDLAVRTKGGQDIWINVSSIRIPSFGRDLCALVHLFRDVTRQKETEDFVEQLRAGVAKLCSLRGVASTTTSGAFLPAQRLTNREREVLRHLFSGASTEAIAEKIGISSATARNHIHNILDKLGVHSRLEAVALALKNGLI